MNKFLNTLTRLIAIFIATVLSGIGVGSLIGIPTWQSGLMSGAFAVAKVVESLARAFSRSGRITNSDIDKSFGLIQPVEQPRPVTVKTDKPKAG